MKLTRLFAAAAFAALALFVSCTENEDLGAAALNVGATEITFEAAENSQALTFTATRDWNVTVSKDAQGWLTVSPASGKASSKEQTVTVEVMENTGYDRSGTVTVNLLSGTLTLDAKTVTVTQKGPGGSNTHEGTKDSPYTVAEALKIIEDGNASENEVFVSGVISAIDTEKDAPGNSYGNATFWIADDGAAETQLEIYRAYGLGGEKMTSADYIKVGDKVIVAGVLVLFKSTPEMTQGGYIYSLNGTVKEKGGSSGSGDQDGKQDSTKGTVDDPYSVQMALYRAGLLGSGAKEENVYVKGKISSIDSGNDAPGNTFGNATYWISDDGGTTAQFEIYRGYGLGGEKMTTSDYIKVGDEVIVFGTIVYYNGKTKEMTQGSQIYSLNGQTSGTDPGDNPGTDPGTPAGTGTADDPYNVAGVAAFAANFEAGQTSDNQVYAKGLVKSIRYQFDAEHGTATYDITDEGTTNSFTVYGNLYLGNRKWEEGDAQIAVGDEVVICGNVTNYSGTLEFASGKNYLVSLNGQTEIAQGEVFGVESTALSVGASATSATVKVKGNVAWTASCDNAAFTLDKTSGQGAAEITVTFSANTDPDNPRVANITVSTTADVATKSYTVVLTQSKAAAAGTTVVTFSKEELATQGNTISSGSVTLTNSSSYTSTVTELRVYKSNTLTVATSSGKITEIVFTCTANGNAKYGPGCFTADKGSYSPESSGPVGTWTGEESSVVFTAGSNQVRVIELKVTVAE